MLLLFQSERWIKKKKKNLNVYIWTEIQLHLPPTPTKMHPCGTIFFSLFWLMFRIYLAFFLSLCNGECVYFVEMCLFFFENIQKRPAHHYDVAKKKNCHQIGSQFDKKKRGTYCLCVYLESSSDSIYVSFGANCWSASNRITINDQEKYTTYFDFNGVSRFEQQPTTKNKSHSSQWAQLFMIALLIGKKLLTLNHVYGRRLSHFELKCAIKILVWTSIMWWMKLLIVNQDWEFRLRTI